MLNAISSMINNVLLGEFDIRMSIVKAISSSDAYGRRCPPWADLEYQSEEFSILSQPLLASKPCNF